ncbi:MAG: chorismate-binding protein, partial [Candidatus Omnitrophica bacterium]|nr:chorismate-binding protein [Candidatus Omnitrophota bacterium]
MNSFSSEDIRGLLNQPLDAPVVFLETASLDKENKESFLFENFHKIITFNSDDDINLFFKRAETYLNKGYWLCGYFSYEFGYFLEPALDKLKTKPKAPLAWVGVCKSPKVITHKKRYNDLLRELKEKDITYQIKNIKPNINRKEYSDRIKKIKTYLEEGLTYQVNYTFKLKFDFLGNALGLYLDLRESQPTGYSAFVNTGKRQILSLSPELFFRKTENKIITRPMKGTVRRGLTLEEDNCAKQFMQGNEKNRAENLMIVDLLR